MRYCVDTDVLIKHLRGHPSVRGKVEAASGEWSISTLTHFELLKGVYMSADTKKALADLDALLAGVPVLPASTAVNMLAAEHFARLRRVGQLLPDPDLLIGATALAHGLILVTGNTAHFSRLTGLKLENWIEEASTPPVAP